MKVKENKDVPLDWSESRLQSELFSIHNEQYKGHRGMLFMVDNNETNGIKGAIALSMGRVPGVSDFILLFAGNAYFIELKLPWKKQQRVQEVWEARVKEEGFEYVVIDSIYDFKQLLFHIYRFGTTSAYVPRSNWP